MERYKNTKKETNKVLRCEKRLAEKRKIEEIEENKNNSRRFFSKTANIKQGYKPQTRILRNELGELVTKEESVVEEFKKHFERLLNKTQPIPTHEDIPMQYSTAEPYIKTPTKLEIYNIIKKLKNNKSPGENNVVAELLKNGGNAIKDEIWKMIKEIWETEVMPGDWNTAILCSIFKKGDTLDPKNYRGISLLDTCYKILSTLLLERITPYAEGIIGRYQCGFIKGKSTIDHIFTLRQTMEKYYEFDMDLYMIFVDYKQAYDSVNRQELWKAMLHFGIPKKYTLSPAFEVNSGLRQGDALSPTLFNLGLEKVIREAYEDRRMEVIGEETILAYADDIVLLGNT
ncbi:hypothetical protein QTP88_020868 [Uroleucon formosanum]